MKKRSAYFASQGWYPADPDLCRSAVDDYFSQAPQNEQAQWAVVVPHAGWRFSGAIAARGFAALDRGFRQSHQGDRPDLVILFAGHTAPLEQPRIMCSGIFATPLGDLSVDEDLARRFCQAFACEQEAAEPRRPDNAIELQLPFIAALWPEAKVLVTTVPADLSAAKMGQTLAAWTADRKAVAIASTDLTHYGAPYGFSPKGSGLEAHRWSKEVNDEAFLQALLMQRDDDVLKTALQNHAACCPGAALAAMHFAKNRAVGSGAETGQILTHQTSFEVGGGAPDMWVGYAALAY